MAGPAFERTPHFNHVAMSLAPDALDEEHRKLRADFYGDVFGFFVSHQIGAASAPAPRLASE